MLLVELNPQIEISGQHEESNGGSTERICQSFDSLNVVFVGDVELGEDCDGELDHLRGGDGLGDGWWDGHFEGFQEVVSIHECVNDIVHPDDPDHVHGVLMVADQGVVAGKGVVVPMHEDQWSLSQHNEYSIQKFGNFRDDPEENPIARCFVGVEFGDVRVGVTESLFFDD